MTAPFERVTGAPAGWADCSDRGLIAATGSDRVRFLNGMVSNDVAALAAGESCPATLLDRKGHVLSDLNVLADEAQLWIETAAGTVDEVLGVLEKHVIADDVELEKLDWGQLAFEGPGSRRWLEARGHPCPEAGHCVRDDADRVWLGGGALSNTGARVLGPRDALAGLTEDLPELSAEAFEILRVEAARPLYGVDLGPRNFPLEARLDSAISETKGCYIGQEIIARLISRGAVNRFLVQLSTPEMVSVGDEIRSGTTKVGNVTSVVLSPLRGPLALGYVRRAESEPGSVLEIGSVSASIVEPLPLDS